MPRPKHTGPHIPEQIAQRVRQARARKGWTQEKLAEALDVATETISRYELGRVPPSLPMLYRLAEALGVDVHSLIGRDAAEPTSTETELLEGWRALDGDEQSMVLNLVRRLSRGTERPKPAAQPGDPTSPGAAQK